jgi:CubicO group peptidase (beta-lactamase class C family)
VDALDLLLLPTRPLKARCRVPRDLAAITVRAADERPPGVVGLREGPVEAIWSAVEALYRTGLFPAIALCVQRRGERLLHRAIGHLRGNGPGEAPGAERVPVRLDTPFVLYSASKAITAMVIHKLDERRVLHLEDRVADWIPEFAGDHRQWITIRHVLSHRAGLPNLPAEAMDPKLLEQPGRVIEILCRQKPAFRPGRTLAYHAITGGFLLGEVVRRATGSDIREVLRKEIARPLGCRWLGYGVRPEEIGRVARDEVTGLPVLPPVSWLVRRALGTSFAGAVELARERSFLTGIVPAANAVATAAELCTFYQCLLDEGRFGEGRVFEARTVRHATVEQSYWDLDLTLGVPIRYGLGFVLGGDVVSPWGLGTRHAFGHVGFTNIFTWADPDRALSVALLTSGKAFLSLDTLRFVNVVSAINRAFPPL